MANDTGHDRTPTPPRARRTIRPGWRLLAPTAACLAVTVWLSGSVGATPARSAAAEPAACTQPQGPPTAPAPEAPTTIDVVEQAYYCILTNYYSGSTLDDRSLVTAAFAAFTEELNRNGRDDANATMPALTGDRHADWAAFETVARRVLGRVPDNAGLPEKLAVAALQGMVASLRDDHASWRHGSAPQPSLGLLPNVFDDQLTNRPGTVQPPLYVKTILGGAAAAAGLRPGDVIESVNGVPPFVNGAVIPAVVAQLSPVLSPDRPADPVRIRLFRPATGRSWTAVLAPTPFRPDPAAVQLVTSKLLPGDVGYVRLDSFVPEGGAEVLAAIAALGTGRTLAGIVLDLRGNHGGSPDAVRTLLSAFAHGAVIGYQCSVDGRCDADRTDDSVALLHLPLVVLTDLGCASACEATASAVKDNHVGAVVGTRTAGAISGLGFTFLLSNNTGMTMPTRHHLGPNREVIDRIGVAPDYYVPRTARDVSTGRDPGVAKALDLLTR
jgi:carboxyl-terminal processing protease